MQHTVSCDAPHLTHGERVHVGAVVQMVEHHISAARIKDVAALVSGTVMNPARTALRVKPRVSDEDITTALRLYLEDNTPITVTLQQLLHRTPQGRGLREQYASCTAFARARCPLITCVCGSRVCQCSCHPLCCPCRYVTEDDLRRVLPLLGDGVDLSQGQNTIVFDFHGVRLRHMDGPARRADVQPPQPPPRLGAARLARPVRSPSRGVKLLPRHAAIAAAHKAVWQERRWRASHASARGDFSFASWNVLPQHRAPRTGCRNFQSWRARKDTIVARVAVLLPDVLCLHGLARRMGERGVEQDVFAEFKAELEAYGYRGAVSSSFRAAGNPMELSALFWRDNTWELEWGPYQSCMGLLEDNLLKFAGPPGASPVVCSVC